MVHQVEMSKSNLLFVKENKGVFYVNGEVNDSIINDIILENKILGFDKFILFAKNLNFKHDSCEYYHKDKFEKLFLK